MTFDDPPATAAWLHRESRQGFEVAFFEVQPEGVVVRGQATGIEDGETRAVGYEIRLDGEWRTREATVSTRIAGGARVTRLVHTDGGWLVDGVEQPGLEGCEDVDLEASSMTNAFPVRRLGLAVGGRSEAPAAYVQALDLPVARLEQSYERLPDSGDRRRFDYRSPQHDYRAELVYDRFGLVLDYPEIAVRAA
jgi:hypothetical protein